MMRKTASILGGAAILLAVAGTARAAPPDNDNFASAAEIPATQFTDATRNTKGATLEHKEQQPCGGIEATVWYRHTPASSGRLVADATGSAFDSVVAIYTGSELEHLTLVGCADDGFFTAARIGFDAVGGTTYFFQVGGFYGKAGSLRFGLYHNVPNDEFAAATVIPAVPFGDELHTGGTGDNEPGEPTPCSSFYPVGGTVWYRYAPTERSRVTLTAAGSDFTVLGGVYTGSTLATLTQVACGFLYYGYGMSFVAVPGQTYSFQLGGYGGIRGSLKLGVTAVPVPANDDFADAIAVPGLPFQDSRSTANATLQPGEPRPCGTIGATVWYAFTPPADASIAVETFGSGFDTVVSVYTGSSLTNLTRVTCNDDSLLTPVFGTSPHESQAIFTVTGGTTYYIQAGGFQGATGMLALSIRSLL
jgi:hypothetical protein